MNSALKWGRALAALLGTLALASTAQARPQDDDDDIQQTVLRVAYLSGNVSYSRGDDPDDWQPASLNFPMTLGDRLYTAGGSRLELQAGGGAIYLAPGSDLAALNLTYDVTQLSLGMGTASFRIRNLDSRETFEVDTPNAAVTFDGPGEYRIDVDRDGNTRVIVRRGYAYVAAAGGEVPLDAGSLMAIDGLDSTEYDITSAPRADSWDRWVTIRSGRYRGTGSRRYVTAGISGVDDLDEYGRWSEVPEYGSCWSPSNVSADWQPYHAGRWTWQDPWGWSWVSNEPWGWAPYHYGRWVRSRARWYWVPVGPSVRRVRYAPALVVFVGGPGFSLSITSGGGGNVGWFPLAPRDPFHPWWGSRARESSRSAPTNVVYANRTSVTVVNRNTFISGAPVARNVIRDARVVREISAAPVFRGPLPLVPIASSIRPSADRARSVARPPAVTLNRPVVTRLAPAPAPAAFRDKVSIIQENRGAPIQPAQVDRPSPGARVIRPTRSVVVEPGRVTLAPKTPREAGPAPVPVDRNVRPSQRRSEPAPESRGGVEQLENRRQKEAEGARREQQQEQLDQRKQKEAEGARREQQQEQLDQRKQKEGAKRPEPAPRASERQAPAEQKAVQPKSRDQKKAPDKGKSKDDKSKDKDKRGEPSEKKK